MRFLPAAAPRGAPRSVPATPLSATPPAKFAAKLSPRLPAACAALLAALLLPAAAFAATATPDPRLDGVKQIERGACQRLGNTGPGAPRNLKLVPRYCDCVARTYWDNLPKAEVDEVMDSGQSAAMDKRRGERLSAARDACQIAPAK